MRRCYLVAAPNATDRSVVAADGDSAASAVPAMVVVVAAMFIVAVTPHSHAANGGIDGNLCGSGNNRRSDSDSTNRQQTKENSAHRTTFLGCEMFAFKVKESSC